MGSAVNHDVWPRLSNFHAEKTCFFFGKSISECSRHFQCFLDGLLQCQKLDNAKCHGWFLENAALVRIKWCVFWHWRSNEANIILGCWILNGQWLPPLIKQDILWCIVLVSLDMFWYALISVAAYPGILQSFMCRMSALEVGHVNCVIPPFDSKDSPQNMGSVSNHRCYYRPYGWR